MELLEEVEEAYWVLDVKMGPVHLRVHATLPTGRSLRITRVVTIQAIEEAVGL